MLRLTLKPDIESLPLLYSFCEAQGLDNRTMLALEETFVNIANYSRAKNVEMTYERRGQALVFVFEDDGKPFDPTAFVVPAEADGESTLRKGGHGIRLMRSMTDGMHYMHEDGKNILTIIKLSKTN